MSIEEFKKAINAVCDEYGYDITGCGCCDSPSIDAREGEEGEGDFNTGKYGE